MYNWNNHCECEHERYDCYNYNCRSNVIGRFSLVDQCNDDSDDCNCNRRNCCNCCCKCCCNCNRKNCC